MKKIAVLIMFLGAIALMLGEALIPEIHGFLNGAVPLNYSDSGIPGYYYVMSFGLFIVGLLLLAVDKSKDPRPIIHSQPITVSSIMNIIIYIAVLIVIISCIVSFFVYNAVPI